MLYRMGKSIVYQVSVSGYDGSDEISARPVGGITIENPDGLRRSVHDGEFLLSLHGPGVARLQDLMSILSDLERAGNFCRLYDLEEGGSDKKDAMFEAAIICYARSFSNGRSAGGKQHRLRAHEFINSLDAEFQGMHQDLVDLRNMHVGHRVENDQSLLIANFDEAGRFTSIDSFHSVLGSYEGAVTDMLAVLEELIPAVENARSEEFQRLEGNCAQLQILDESVPKMDVQSGSWIERKIQRSSSSR